jgi:chromosome segregation ATPase
LSEKDKIFNGGRVMDGANLLDFIFSLGQDDKPMHDAMEDLFGHGGGMHGLDMLLNLAKNSGQKKLKSPEIIFLEANNEGRKTEIAGLQEVISAFYKRCKQQDIDLEEAKKTESGLREDLDKQDNIIVRQERQISKCHEHLKSQAEAQKGRQQELSKLQEKMKNIELCLNEVSSDKALKSDLQSVIEKITDVVTAA